jgi:hypothetical protein
LRVILRLHIFAPSSLAAYNGKIEVDKLANDPALLSFLRRSFTPFAHWREIGAESKNPAGGGLANLGQFFLLLSPLHLLSECNRAAGGEWSRGATRGRRSIAIEEAVLPSQGNRVRSCNPGWSRVSHAFVRVSFCPPRSLGYIRSGGKPLPEKNSQEPRKRKKKVNNTS